MRRVVLLPFRILSSADYMSAGYSFLRAVAFLGKTWTADGLVSSHPGTGAIGTLATAFSRQCLFILDALSESPSYQMIIRGSFSDAAWPFPLGTAIKAAGDSPLFTRCRIFQYFRYKKAASNGRICSLGNSGGNAYEPAYIPAGSATRRLLVVLFFTPKYRTRIIHVKYNEGTNEENQIGEKETPKVARRYEFISKCVGDQGSHQK